MPNLDYSSVEPPTREILERMKALRSGWPQEPALDHLNPSMIDEFIKLAHLNITASTKYAPTLVLLTLLMCLCFGIAVLFPGAMRIISVPLTMTCLYSSIRLCVLFTHHLPFSEPKYVVYALTRVRDIRVLPILLNAVGSEYGKHREVVRAIWRLLPLVTSEHTGMFNAEQQIYLWHLIKNNYGLSVRIDILSVEIGLTSVMQHRQSGDTDAHEGVDK